MSKYKPTKIGIVIGSGTGKELVEVFKKILTVVSSICKRSIEFVESSHIFNTYFSLHKFPIEEIRRRNEEDLKILDDFYNKCYKEGCRIIFRTAINAEVLYLFRKKYMGIKVIEIQKNECRILIVRDQTQGYYANDKWNYCKNKQEIHFEGYYRKENIQKILEVARGEAKYKLRRDYEIWVVYKHHLFGNIIEKWIKEMEPKAILVQPNNMIQIFYETYLKKPDKDLLIIMGNEIGDIFHEIFIYSLGLGERRDFFSKTIFLSPQLSSLIEYQTLHGSADELAGKNMVDPTATIKICGDIAENFLNCSGVISIINKAIENAKKSYKMKEFNTSKFTEYVEDFILKHFSEDAQKRI
jgi:isocitrate/isopropylmalate dehydrogenase